MAADLQGAYLATVQVLAAAIAARDSGGLGHVGRLLQYAAVLGREWGWSARQLLLRRRRTSFTMWARSACQMVC